MIQLSVSDNQIDDSVKHIKPITLLFIYVFLYQWYKPQKTKTINNTQYIFCE